MSEEPTPQTLTTLREEFKDVADNLNSGLIALPKYSNKAYDLIELTRVHIKNNSDHVRRITDLINEGLADTENKTAKDVHRVVRRIGKEIDGLIDGYDEVRCLLPYEDDFKPWALLIEIYHDTLCQLQQWLADVLEKLDEILATEIDRSTDCQTKQTVIVHLEIKAPNAMVQLADWLTPGI